MTKEQWTHAFIAELCKRHPEANDWISDEVPNIIEMIESRAGTSETTKTSTF